MDEYNFRYIYTDEIELTSEEVVAVVQVARKYVVTSLENRSTKFMFDRLNSENACQILNGSLTIADEDLKKHTLSFIETNSDEVFESDQFSNLTYDALLLIATNTELSIPEIGLIQAVCKWANAECDRLDLPQTRDNKRHILRDIFDELHFHMLSPQELCKVVAYNVLIEQEVANTFIRIHSSDADGPVSNESWVRGSDSLMRSVWFCCDSEDFEKTTFPKQQQFVENFACNKPIRLYGLKISSVLMHQDIFSSVKIDITTGNEKVLYSRSVIKSKKRDDYCWEVDLSEPVKLDGEKFSIAISYMMGFSDSWKADGGNPFAKSPDFQICGKTKPPFSYLSIETNDATSSFTFGKNMPSQVSSDGSDSVLPTLSSSLTAAKPVASTVPVSAAQTVDLSVSQTSTSSEPLFSSKSGGMFSLTAAKPVASTVPVSAAQTVDLSVSQTSTSSEPLFSSKSGGMFSLTAAKPVASTVPVSAAQTVDLSVSQTSTSSEPLFSSKSGGMMGRSSSIFGSTVSASSGGLFLSTPSIKANANPSAFGSSGTTVLSSSGGLFSEVNTKPSSLLFGGVKKTEADSMFGMNSSTTTITTSSGNVSSSRSTTTTTTTESSKTLSSSTATSSFKLDRPIKTTVPTTLPGSAKNSASQRFANSTKKKPLASNEVFLFKIKKGAKRSGGVTFTCDHDSGVVKALIFKRIYA